MNENFTSLVFFTVLSQTAAGALILRELIILFWDYDFISVKNRSISLTVISSILLFSLVIAFLHLGNPMLAFNAINNLGKSWLSREIFSLTILLASLLLYLIVSANANFRKTEKVFSVVIITCCLLLVFSMIMLYMIPSVISWNTPFTPLSFVITTILCGIILLQVFFEKTDNRVNSDTAKFITALIVLSIANSIIFQGSFLKQEMPLFIIRATFSLFAFLISSINIFRTRTNKTCIWWVILFVMVLSSEIINRYIFFLSFEKSGL
jgi:anaerobic dimethyl sulfoxide reductase subunit C (anchor subunit)